MFPFSPTPFLRLPTTVNDQTENKGDTDSDGLESSTTTLHSSLSPVTPPSSPEFEPFKGKPNPRASSSPIAIGSESDREEDEEEGGKQLQRQPNYSINCSSYLSLPSVTSMSSAYMTAAELEDNSPPGAIVTPTAQSPLNQILYPQWEDQIPAISVSPVICSKEDEEEEENEDEFASEGTVQRHLTLPPSRCQSVLSLASSTESIASTVVEELVHQSFPPPFFIDGMRQTYSPTPPPSALPEWAPTRQEVLQMRSYIADTSKGFPYLWHNTVHYIKEKIDTEQVCIGRYTIANGLLEVLAEAISCNIIPVLELIQDFLPEFRGKNVNQLFSFHALSKASRYGHTTGRHPASCPLLSLLHIAVRLNNADVVRVLIQDFDASPDLEDSNGLTAVHIAVMSAIRIISRSQQPSSEWSAATTIVSHLLSDGRGDPNKPTEDGLTPLAMAVRYLLFSETQLQSSPQLVRRQSDPIRQSISNPTPPSAFNLPHKLVSLLLHHGAIPGTSLHRMSFLRSTFTASLQSCTAEELVNRLIPFKEQGPKLHKLKVENFAVRDVRLCSRNTQSQLYALSGCQLVFQELRQHKVNLQCQPTRPQAAFPPDIGPSYLLLPVVQIKQQWTQSLKESESLEMPFPKSCEAYSFRKELETVDELEDLWKSSNLTDEIVYQSLIIMERCLGRDDLITLEMLVLAHNWLISAQQADRSNLLFMRFMESLVSYVEGIPTNHSAEGFFTLIELEHFISTVVFGSSMGDLLLSPLSPQTPTTDFSPIEQFPQEYVMFASCIVPALSSRVSHCPIHRTTGHLPFTDSLINNTIQNAMFLISSRVTSYGTRGSMVRWMMQTLARTCFKIFNSNGSNTTILHLAIDLANDTKLVAALLKFETTKSVVNEPRRNGAHFDLPIHNARTPDMVRLLVDYGAHIDAVDSAGRTLSTVRPSAWLRSPSLPDKLLGHVYLPPLTCLASRAVVSGQVPYQLMAIPSAIRTLIQLHNPTRTC